MFFKIKDDKKRVILCLFVGKYLIFCKLLF
nr:MAG TPA: hypothetical protein [Caudoviricetes sp.]